MRNWVEQKFIMLGTLGIVIGALTFSGVPIFI